MKAVDQSTKQGTELQEQAGGAAMDNKIVNGSIFGQLLLFFFPILFGTFFQQLYNTADAMVVGRFVGKQALAAVGGSTSTLINLLVGFFVGLSSGATVVISQFYGARKADKVHWAVHTSIAFSIIGGIAFMIIGLAGSPWALEAMKTPEDVMGHSVVYIRIYFLGIIVNLIYNMGAGILRAVGDSRRPLYFLIASCFTNIALDILLVAVLGMGVAGAAIATISSQLLSAILVVRALMKTDDMYTLEHPWYGQCDGLGYLRQSGRPVLDDDQCPGHIGHHLCGPELWRRAHGPGAQGGRRMHDDRRGAYRVRGSPFI